MYGHIGDRQGFAMNRRTRAWRGTALGHTLVVDGIFGPKTEAWVRGFQRAMASEIPGFSVDGIVGPQTWRALVSEALSG